MGGESKSELIFPRHVERFARDAGLAVPPALKRVPTLASKILEAIPKVDQPHEISEKVAELIGGRCERFISRFK